MPQSCYSVHRPATRFTFFVHITIFVLMVSFAAACTRSEPDSEPVSEPVPQETIAFVGVTVVPMDEEHVIPDQTVLVRDGRIAAGDADVSVPNDALRIEAHGMYLMPGLADMHGHLPTGDGRRGIAEESLFLYVANGVTSVRSMHGHPDQFDVRNAVVQGDLLGPRLVLAGPGLSGDLSAEDAVRQVREHEEAGYDLIKILEGLSPETYEAAVSAAREVSLPVAGHVPDAVGLWRVLETGPATIEHLDNYVEALIPSDALEGAGPLVGLLGAVDQADETRISEVVSATLSSGTASVPTMALYVHTVGDRTGDELRSEIPEVRYLPSELVDGWVQGRNGLHPMVSEEGRGQRVLDLRLRVFRALHESGAPILLGSDSPQMFNVPGFSAHRELALMVESGMSPYEALRTGTWNVAEHFNDLDSSGWVASGKRADLILLEANPLEDVSHVARRVGVVVDGRWLPEEEIQRRLDALSRAHR